MGSHMAETVNKATLTGESAIQAFERYVCNEYERGGRSFVPLLLEREQEASCKGLRSLIASVTRHNGGDGYGSALHLLVAFGLMLSSLTRLPCPTDQELAIPHVT